MSEFKDAEEKMIDRAYDYSNVLPEIENVLYLVQYIDQVYNKMLEIYRQEDQKNERLKYEYRNYGYKNHYSSLEITVRKENYDQLSFQNFETFSKTVRENLINNIAGMSIKLYLNYQRGSEGQLVNYDNFFRIIFEPYKITFKRTSNHSEELLDMIEANITKVMENFKVANCIFCTKQ